MPARLFCLTVAAGKRLIAKAIANDKRVLEAIEKHKLIVLAGTTNRYILSELAPQMDTSQFFRGLTLAPGTVPPKTEKVNDCVITKQGADMSKDIFSLIPYLEEGDVILKGANAVHIPSRTAGVLIGHIASGTIGACAPHVIGKRIRLILPVGVEKRVDRPIAELAAVMNEPGAQGPRLYPAPGEAYTELDALRDLAGVQASVAAGGGVAGAEGATYFLCEGSVWDLERCAKLVTEVAKEPAFRF